MTTAPVTAGPRTDLDDAQRRVVDHDGGPLLVLGSPGTGKTTVLVERWVRLAHEVIAPHRVLLLVPKRERALALRDELPWRLEARAIIEVPVHTWHAFAYHLVSRYYPRLGYAAPPVRLTNAEQWTVVRDLLHDADADAWGPFGEHLRSEAVISEVADFCIRAGHRGLSDADLHDLGLRRPDHAAVASFAVAYRAHLERTGALDYPGLLGAARRLLETCEDIGGAVRRRFPHVLADDAQELAPVQLGLLRYLSTEHLVCAGDPDSAIEAFRGADPAWLGRFSDVAPGHETVVFPACHRSGPHAAGPASRLIAHEPSAGPHRATVFAGPAGPEPVLRIHATLAGEIEAAARDVRRAHLYDGVPYERMAILLAQPSTYAHPLGRLLDQLGVPYRLDSGDRPLGAEPAVAGVLQLCRLALGAEKEAELIRGVMRSPLVGAHPQRVRDLEREAFKHNEDLWTVLSRDSSEEASELRRLCEIAGAEPDEPADATLARVFEGSRWCASLAATRGTDPESRHHLDALVALQRALGHFVERRPGGTMLAYVEASGSGGVVADSWSPEGRATGVHVMSLHASKGLEWDVVCVLGIAEGQLPKAHRAQGLFDPWALDEGNAVDRAQSQLAEERRTLYVALTRARQTLVVSCSPGARRATPSRFLEEAFGSPLPEPIVAAEPDPLTLDELASSLRRVIAGAWTTTAQRAAATAALARMPDIDPSAWWWRREFTPGAELVPDGHLTTSYSRIGKYDECPLRYVLESVLGLDPQSTYQMKFGSLVHRVIERADPVFGDITSWEEAFAAFRDEFVEHHREDYPNDVFARTYFRYGRDSLRRWWNTERTLGTTVAVEFAFDDLDVDGHTIRGRIDRVARGTNGLILSDYKTSRTPAEYEDVEESLQLAIYSLAARRYEALSKHGDPVLMQLIYPGIEHTDRKDGSAGCTKRRQTLPQADIALERLRTDLDNAAAEHFEPDPEADCRWCRMKPLCPRWAEGREVPQ